MNEIRQSKTTGQWVIFATARGKRPHQFAREEKEEPALMAHDKTCPFCPGNEATLPTIILEIEGKENGEWQTRVIPNKFPALTPDGNSERTCNGIYVAMAGYGRHEVIIESPYHNEQIGTMQVDHVETVIETYHRRFTDLMKEHENMTITLFRNHGPHAGTSLIHPHSQMIVTGMVPNYIRWREEEAQRYFDAWGRCVYCDIMEFEMADRRRVVFENASFIALVPYAAEVPFEVWIIPRQHQASFGQISGETKLDLAVALRDILGRLHRRLKNPDYNYVIVTSPQYKAEEPQLHWYLQIRPRLTTRAGFEIGSGISINPTLPEEDADFLNKEK
jgi:UDPglucose--hexose-1-phosphate uridylyltransferase